MTSAILRASHQSDIHEVTSSREWYSAEIRLACLIEDSGAECYMDSIVLMRAASFEDAFTRAIALGREREENYKNGDGQTVKWSFVAVQTLDRVPQGDLDGAEVHSSFVEVTADEAIHFDAKFDPEASEPSQTI